MKNNIGDNMDYNIIAHEIYEQNIKGLDEDDFNNLDIQQLIANYMIEVYGNDIEEKIIYLHKYEKYNDSKIKKIIDFCQEFDLDDIDILNQMWSGAETAWDYIDLYVPDKEDPDCMIPISLDEVIEGYNLDDLLWVIDEYNLDTDIILDEIDLYRQVQNVIDECNHARMYYDNQLYYDEKIEAIQDAYDNL